MPSGSRRASPQERPPFDDVAHHAPPVRAGSGRPCRTTSVARLAAGTALGSSTVSACRQAAHHSRPRSARSIVRRRSATAASHVRSHPRTIRRTRRATRPLDDSAMVEACALANGAFWKTSRSDDRAVRLAEHVLEWPVTSRTSEACPARVSVVAARVTGGCARRRAPLGAPTRPACRRRAGDAARNRMQNGQRCPVARTVARVTRWWGRHELRERSLSARRPAHASAYVGDHDGSQSIAARQRPAARAS